MTLPYWALGELPKYVLPSQRGTMQVLVSGIEFDTA